MGISTYRLSGDSDSKRISVIETAFREKTEKLTPSPVTVDPRGVALPGTISLLPKLINSIIVHFRKIYYIEPEIHSMVKCNMKKKVILFCALPFAAFILFWIFSIIMFPSIEIERVQYNKNRIDRAVRERNSSHQKALDLYKNELNVFFTDHIDFMFAGMDGSDEIKNRPTVRAGNIISNYYQKAKEIDDKYYRVINSHAKANSFPLQRQLKFSMLDLYQPKFSVVKDGNILYDEIALNMLSLIIEKLNYDFNDATEAQITKIFDDLHNEYSKIVSDPLSNGNNFYDNRLSNYISLVRRLADSNGEYFDFLLSECTAAPFNDLLVNEIEKPVQKFPPVNIDVYSINGKYYLSSAYNKTEHYLVYLLNDWRRYGSETLPGMIMQKTDIIAADKDGLAGLPEITESAGFQYYREMLSGRYIQYLIDQCGISGEISDLQKNIINSGNTGFNRFSLPSSLATRIEGSLYDKNAIDALMESMKILSNADIQTAKEIMIRGVNSQTNSYMYNIDDYARWYFSIFTGIDKAISMITSYVTGNFTEEEKYAIDNFNRIMNRATNFDYIINEEMSHLISRIARIEKDYLEIKDFFTVDFTPVIDPKNISVNEYISPYRDTVGTYFSQVNEAMNSLIEFYIEDFSANDKNFLRSVRDNLTVDPESGFVDNLAANILSFQEQQAKNSEELKQQLTKRLTETQENKILIINDPQKVIEDKLQIGSVIYVKNYFVGFPTYKHYGVYIGDNKVAHFAPLEGQEISFENGIIHETTLENFLRDRALRVDLDVEAIFSEREIIHRALSRLGEKNYNLLTNNCEHYARWCVTGNSISYQVENFPRQIEDTYNEIKKSYDVIVKLLEFFR